jgi:hypothetical protein
MWFLIINKVLINKAKSQLLILFATYFLLTLTKTLSLRIKNQNGFKLIQTISRMGLIYKIDTFLKLEYVMVNF